MIETTENKINFTIGTSRVFDFDIPFFDENDIRCYTFVGDTQHELVRGTDFTIAKYPDHTDFFDGGKITLIGDLPPAGTKLVIARILDLTQDVDLPLNGKLPSTSVETQLDKIVCMVQQQQEALDRCVKVEIASGKDPEDYFVDVMRQINLSVESCVYSAESAAGSAASSAAVAAFVGNCMTEITGNPEYAEKAARSFYNIEQQYGAVLAAGTATLNAVRDGGVNAVTLAGQTAALTVQEQGRTEVESITGAGGTYTAAIARAEGTMTVYLAGCSAAAANADATAGQIAAMEQSVSVMKTSVEQSLDAALEAGTVCTVQAGSCSQYTAASLEALQEARACVTDASGYASSASGKAGEAAQSAQSALSKAGEAAQSAQSALAKAGEAAQSAAAAYAAELAAGTIAEQTANLSITVHNASALAHQDIRQLVTAHNAATDAHSGIRQSVTALGGTVADISAAVGTKAPLESPAFTGTPTAPTAADGDSSTQLATTEFVNRNASKAPAYDYANGVNKGRITTFTAPTDGLAIFFSANADSYCKINQLPMYYMVFNSGTYFAMAPLMFPLSAGDTITGFDFPMTWQMYWIPAK